MGLHLSGSFLPAVTSYVLELLLASYSAVRTKYIHRYERVVLAYHGFTKNPKHEHDREHPHVYPIDSHKPRIGFMAKRLRPTTTEEASVLRFLALPALQGARNHTAFPSQIIWGNRILVTPMYYQTELIARVPPNVVLSMAKQLTEAVAFLHENHIVHLDITWTNVLIALHPTFAHPRLLLTDFEFSRHFSEEDAPQVDLWWRRKGAPEGLIEVDGYAFDVWCIGMTIAGLTIYDYFIRKFHVGIVWPDGFLSLVQRMRQDDPASRPSAREAQDLLSLLDEDQHIVYQGEAQPTKLDFTISLGMYPSMRKEVLPVPMAPTEDEE